MQAQVSAPVPEHDPQTNAVLMYSETVVTVQPNGNRRRLERRVFRILRPEGGKRGLAVAIFDSRSRIASIHGWCIPATGKEFEVKDRDAIETGLAGIAGSELISDVRARMLSIPAAVPGSLVGYEFERESYLNRSFDVTPAAFITGLPGVSELNGVESCKAPLPSVL